jgi:hypothetical protein
MQTATDRIGLIERSLRCFVFGLLSLVPLLGLGPAVIALRLHFRTWSESGGEWNPARRYVTVGFWLAWTGILVSLLSVALFVVLLIKIYDF